MSDDDQNNARAQQAAAMAAARGQGIGLSQAQMHAQANRMQAMQGACRGALAGVNEQALQRTEQQAYTGLAGALKEAVDRETEECALLAESHGFPTLAEYIRKRRTPM